MNEIFAWTMLIVFVVFVVGGASIDWLMKENDKINKEPNE